MCTNEPVVTDWIHQQLVLTLKADFQFRFLLLYVKILSRAKTTADRENKNYIICLF